ncbi:MFS transporter [Candidatus Solirubrobacter pratensis]|uniref:MFS transporter n=1 Tax=Candidatus Solirubrobacter pratensis TaxID=1298857 RepID=UPI00042427E6|nr:MFS transporter [Candidatus Solirubrobacter pratensis]
MHEFRRDRMTWIAYAMLAWFAYLQAAPGMIVPHLRDELHLSYSAGGLHVAGFAAGSLLAGFIAGPLERGYGRKPLFWCSAVAMGAGAALLTAGRVEAVTLAAMLVMGIGGGLLLITVQALLADRHGELRTIALTEANVAASAAYVVLIGGLALAAALSLGWRAALLAVLLLPPAGYLFARREPLTAPPPPPRDHGTLPARFWVAAAMVFFTTGAEWCVTGWGASFVRDAAGVSTDTGVTLMGGYFAGVLAGRIAGSALARRYAAYRLLAGALALTALGFAVLWPATSPAVALAGLTIVGLGLGNLFPLGLSVTVGLAPDHAQLASARIALVTSSAVLLAPLTVGALADATSITAALAVVPAALALAAVGLTFVTRAQGARPLAAQAPTSARRPGAPGSVR